MESLFWKLPADKIRMAGIVRSLTKVRGGWGQTRGEIRAPKEMFAGDDPRAICGVGWSASGSYFEPRMTSEHPCALKHRSHIADLITGKLPGFYTFDISGPDDQATELVARFVAFGYQGHMDMSWPGGFATQMTTQPLWVKCDFRFNEWKGRDDEPGLQPARVRIIWHDDAGYKGYAEEKIKTLQDLGLEQYAPSLVIPA